MALEWDTAVPESVTATVEKGYVTLHGEVEREYQRQAAERAVRCTPATSPTRGRRPSSTLPLRRR
jgi:hypothetical protein